MIPCGLVVIGGGHQKTPYDQKVKGPSRWYFLNLTHHPTNFGDHRTWGSGDMTTIQHTKIIGSALIFHGYPVACKKSGAFFNILVIFQFKKSCNLIGHEHIGL